MSTRACVRLEDVGTGPWWFQAYLLRDRWGDDARACLDAGAAGVRDCLDAITSDLREAMALAGAASLREISHDLVAGGGPVPAN